ncbi:MAG: hypothetical protein WC675_05835 [Patescibacteria group bacterium]|jgi:Tfp pilus assembly protein PilX
MSKFTNQSGMILILAVLIIAAILGAAAIFSNLIIREIQQVRLIDQSIQAFYLAESGAERSLHQVRRREAIRDCCLVEANPEVACANPGNYFCKTNSHCSNNNTIPCINPTGSSSRGSWEINAANESETSIVLKNGESFQIDLFNPYQTQSSNINAIQVDRSDPGVVAVGEFTNLTKILGISTAVNCQEQPPVFKYWLPSPDALITSHDGWKILAACSYSFKLIYPLDSSGEGETEPPILATIRVFNTDPEPDKQLEIPSRFVIDSQASFRNSLQKVRVRTPIRSPLSGLYDFVLFSEERIVK